MHSLKDLLRAWVNFKSLFGLSLKPDDVYRVISRPLSVNYYTSNNKNESYPQVFPDAES